MNLNEIYHANPQIQTPCYLFDLDQLEQHIKAVKNAFPGPIQLCYAMKANPFLVGIMSDFVDSFEVCSSGEYRICQRQKIPNRKIILSGVYKDPNDLESIIKMDEQPIYTIESLRHLEILDELSRRYRKTIKVLIRLTSGNQFGVDLKTLEQILKNKNNYPFLHWHGIQLYSGTQKHKICKIKKELEELKAYIEILRKRYEVSLPCLEFGPGLGVRYFEADKTEVSIETFGIALDDLNFQGEIVLEMGRILVASCGVYLTKVVDIKHNDTKNYAILDGGIHHMNYYGQFLGMKQPIINRIAVNPKHKATQSWHLCGALCTVSDVLVKDFETTLEQEDVLAFMNVGAYSITEGISLFLSRDLPQVCFYRNETGLEIVRESVQIDFLNSIKEQK